MEPADAHGLWRAGRDDLLGNYPCSLIPTCRRTSFSGLPVAAWSCPLAPLGNQLETAIEAGELAEGF